MKAPPTNFPCFCEDCKAFVQPYNGEGKPLPKGECRCHPPSNIYMGMFGFPEMGMFGFPEVAPSDCCLDGIRRPAHDANPDSQSPVPTRKGAEG